MSEESSTLRAVGQVEGKLEMLIEAVEENREAGSKGRQRIYEELEAIRANASASKVKIEKLKAQMTAAAPAIADIGRWKERFIGMRMLIVFLSATAGGMLVAAWKWLIVKFGM